MNSKMKHILLFVLGAAAISLFGAGCNTMHGVGKDVERAGEKIQDNSK
jgi:predicted small secreted protein